MYVDMCTFSRVLRCSDSLHLQVLAISIVHKGKEVPVICRWVEHHLYVREEGPSLEGGQEHQSEGEGPCGEVIMHIRRYVCMYMCTNKYTYISAYIHTYIHSVHT